MDEYAHEEEARLYSELLLIQLKTRAQLLAQRMGELSLQGKVDMTGPKLRQTHSIQFVS